MMKDNYSDWNTVLHSVHICVIGLASLCLFILLKIRRDKTNAKEIAPQRK